jgi:hypothetical protein
MTPEITPEQLDALGDGPQTEIVDPVSGRTFVVIEKTFYAINHLDRTCDAIQQGIDAANAGQTQPVNEAFDEIRSELGFQKHG